MCKSDETARDSEAVSWSPLMIVVGIVLQFVMQFFVSFVVLLIPSMVSAAVQTTGKFNDTFMWLGSLSSFLGALAVLIIVRRRFNSLLMLFMHVVAPAVIVVGGNMAATANLRGWMAAAGGVALAAIGRAAAVILHILLCRSRSLSDSR